MSAPPPRPNRKRRRLAIGTALALIVLGATAAVVIGTRPGSPLPASSPEPEAAGGASALVINGLQQTAARDGVTEWILNAATGVFLQEEKHFLLSEPRVTFFRPQGQAFFLSARNGSLATERRDMDAEGEVVMWNEHYRIRAERVHYSHAIREIESDRPVTITGDRREITADQGTVDLTGNRLRLAGNIRGLFPAGSSPANDDTLKIASDRMLVDMDREWAEFSGRVRLDQNATVTTTDTLTVHYTVPAKRTGPATGSPEDVTLTRIVARGNVAVTRAEVTATADEALYDPAAGSLTLTGRPATMKSPSALVRGERIVVFPHTRRLRAESGSAGQAAVVWAPPASRP